VACPQPDALGRLPANVRAARYIPYGLAAAHVDVMVTNGGFGGVHVALAHGVPMVAAGGHRGQPETCARIGWTGVGVDLRTGSPTARRCPARCGRCWTTPPTGGPLAGWSRKCRRHDPPGEAAGYLEELVRADRPTAPVR